MGLSIAFWVTKLQRFLISVQRTQPEAVGNVGSTQPAEEENADPVASTKI